MKIDKNATSLVETNDRFTQYVIEKEHIHQRLDFIDDSVNELRGDKLDRSQFYENNTTLSVQLGNIQKSIAEA